MVAGLFGWGAWQRRWIADDGLIVLRTVRNLLAGNGPVFNKGERVEANTSTVWTYLVTLGGWIGGSTQLEYVALVLALTLSVLGIVLAMLGTGRLYAPGLRGRRALLLPAGAVVYIAIPPARDFATSGLENGLVLAYLGLLWWMMVCWSQALRLPAIPARPGDPGVPPERNATSRVFDGSLAFVGGLSVLVRPELALIGGLALVMMLVAARGWRRRLLIVVAGGLLPVAYQVFRMGYYGLLVPGTAIAKDASGSKWHQGFLYLTNFNRPYLLWAPVMLLAAIGLVLFASRTMPWWTRHQIPRGYGRAGAVDPKSACRGLLHAAEWVGAGRSTGCARAVTSCTAGCCSPRSSACLLPVAVIPVVLPDGSRRMGRETGFLLAGATSAIWLAVVGWSVWAAMSPGMGSDATRVTYSGSWTSAASTHRPPVMRTRSPRPTTWTIRGCARCSPQSTTRPSARCCCRPAITTSGTWCPPSRHHSHRRARRR